MSARRSENFSLEERNELLVAVKEHINDIEDKRCDASANKKKQVAWCTVTQEISSSLPNGPTRTTKEWKELWRRMKTKAKAAAREKKADIVQTGGGKAVVGDLGDENIAVLNLIIGELEQMYNKFDDDSDLNKKAADISKCDDDAPSGVLSCSR